MVRETASWSWDNHPWSGGAYAWYHPGQHTQLHRHVVAPEGRIYFAGEHASLTHTWMQGALESGRDAVRALLTSAQNARSSVRREGALMSHKGLQDFL